MNPVFHPVIGEAKKRRVRSFTPANLPNLELWLRGDRVTLDGSNVSLWDDQGYFGNGYAQPTPGLQPLPNATGINGKPTVDFDGTDDWVGEPFWINGPQSIFMVFKLDALPGASSFATLTILSGTVVQDGTANGAAILAANSTGYQPYSFILNVNGTKTMVGIADALDTDPHALLITFSGTTTADAEDPTKYRCWLDGVERTVVTSGSIDITAYGDQATVGASSNGLAPAQIKAAELAVCAADISLYQPRLNAYSISRYGLGALDPLTLSGIMFLFDAAQGVALNGSNVATWGDRGPSGVDLAQPLALYQLPYHASGGPNNEPYVECNASGFMTAPAGGQQFGGLTGYTYYIVRKTNDSVAAQVCLCVEDAVFGDQQTSDYDASNYPGGYTLGAQSSTSFLLKKLVYDGTGVTNDDKLKCWINGTPLTMSFNVGNVPSSLTTPSTDVVYLSSYFSGGYPWDGGVAYIVAFNRILTAGEQAGVETYFLRRFGL